MAQKTETKPELEREYIIPLRKEWRKVANYRRTGRAIKAIKKFIARHMKVPEHDVSKVKLDIYLNNEIFFRGRKKPPAKIKVKAVREGDVVKVRLAEIPTAVKFLKIKHEKRSKPAEKPKDAPPAPAEVPGEKPVEEGKEKPEEKKERTEEEKKEEKEKSRAVAEVREKDAKTQAKQQKSAGAKTKQPTHHRLALKK
ncbi:MAG: 50S ribosomal protein L31e [Nanoarchaeota archaeon]|nr:50S ribosomal protein L31e [Nanoarchaeota archaeon]MBU1103959.1 50S ribosomal protein L31e [Nanoarchaeota archaeon]